MKMKEKKFAGYMKQILENKYLGGFKMRYIEMTIDEAIDVLKKSKGKKVLVAIQDLEKDEPALFSPKLKSDCLIMIEQAKTISSVCDDFVEQLRLFTEKQLDLRNIRPEGLQQTILLKT